MDISQLVQDVIDGNENALKAYGLLKDLSKQVSEALKEVEGAAIDEAQKFGEKTFNSMDWKFELRDGARRYNFKNIPQWVEMNKKMKDAEKLYKSASSAFEKGQNIIDENGEVVPAAEVTYSKQSLIAVNLGR